MEEVEKQKYVPPPFRSYNGLVQFLFRKLMEARHKSNSPDARSAYAVRAKRSLLIADKQSAIAREISPLINYAHCLRLGEPATQCFIGVANSVNDILRY